MIRRLGGVCRYVFRPAFNRPGRCVDMLRVVAPIVGLVLAIVILYGVVVVLPDVLGLVAS